MILQWIYEKLVQKRNKERHNLIRLEWQKAELERKVAAMRNNEYRN